MTVINFKKICQAGHFLCFGYILSEIYVQNLKFHVQNINSGRFLVNYCWF